MTQPQPTHVSDDLKLRAVQHYLASLNYAAASAAQNQILDEDAKPQL